MNIYNYIDTFALADMKKGRKNWRVKLRMLIGLFAFLIDLGLVLF